MARASGDVALAAYYENEALKAQIEVQKIKLAIDEAQAAINGMNGQPLGGRCMRQGASLQPVHRALHGVGHFLQLPPSLGQPPLAAFARKQYGTELLFQRLNAPRHRGVLDSHAPRSRRHAAAARQFAKKTQMVPVQCLSLRFVDQWISRSRCPAACP